MKKKILKNKYLICNIEYIPIDEAEGVALDGGFYAVVFRTHKGKFYTKVKKQ